MIDIYTGMTKTAQKLLQDELKIQWTYNSNSIEGNTISLGDTAFIIEYGLTVKGKSLKEHNEVIGHARAIDLIYDYLAKDTLGKQDLFDLHKAIQTNIVIDIECPIGAYKVVENGRFVKVDDKREYQPYPHPCDIEYLMDIWFGEFRNITKADLTLAEAIKKYTRSHIGFTAIHPFFDGNGRVGRLLANIPMLKNGYLPLIVSVENRDIYIDLLSRYNLYSNVLDKNSAQIIEENDYFWKLYEFFANEYNNSQKILDDIKGKLK